MKLLNQIRAKIADPDNRQLASNVVGNYGIKGAAMILSIVVMPAYFAFFSSQALLGAWFAAVAVVNWTLYFDFGIGSGVRNAIVPLLEKGDQKGIDELLTSAYIVSSLLALMLGMLLFAIVNQLDWCEILGLGVGAANEDELTTMVSILLCGILIRFPLVIVLHVLYAMQRAVIPNFLVLMSSLLIFLYLVVSNYFGMTGSYISLAVATAVANALPPFIASFFVYGKKGLNIKFSLRNFSLSAARSTLGLGGTFFLLQILFAAVFQVKEPFISFFVGSAEVVDYQVYQKLIGTAGTLFVLALNPVWSAATKAYYEGRYSWLRKLQQAGLVGVAVFSFVEVLLLVGAPSIIEIWLAGEVDVSYIEGIVFCLYNTAYMLFSLYYNVMCGIGRTKPVVFGLGIGVVLNITLATIFSAVFRSWTSIIAATAIAVLPSLIILPFNFNRLFRRVSPKAVQ